VIFGLGSRGVGKGLGNRRNGSLLVSISACLHTLELELDVFYSCSFACSKMDLLPLYPSFQLSEITLWHSQVNIRASRDKSSLGKALAAKSAHLLEGGL
jgi:hypothetical protein